MTSSKIVPHSVGLDCPSHLCLRVIKYMIPKTDFHTQQVWWVESAGEDSAAPPEEEKLTEAKQRV